MTRVQDNPIIISRLHDAILRHVYTFHYLRLEQVMRLMNFGPNSDSNCRKLLKQLVNADYLFSPKLPRAYLGNPPFVYALDRNGLNYLDDLGYDTDFRFRPNEYVQPSFFWLNHMMHLNDFLICASFLEKVAPEIVLETLIHEWIIRRRFGARVDVRIKKETGGVVRRNVGCIPDAFLNFRFRGNKRMPVLVELDTGSESRWKIKEKIYALLAYVDGPYKKLFQTDMHTIAYVVPDGDTHRRDQLLSYIEAVLEESNLHSASDVFYVCALPTGSWSPLDVFLAPLWYRPFEFAKVAKSEANARFPGCVFVSSADVSLVKVYDKPMPLISEDLML